MPMTLKQVSQANEFCNMKFHRVHSSNLMYRHENVQFNDKHDRNFLADARNHLQFTN